MSELKQERLIQVGVAFKPIADQLIATDMRRDFRERGRQPVPEGCATMNDVVPTGFEEASLQRQARNTQILLNANGPS